MGVFYFLKDNYALFLLYKYLAKFDKNANSSQMFT